MKQLEAKNLGVQIGSKILLHPTTLVFTTGALTAIVGPNGAGKSTLVKGLLGLVASTGEVLLDGSPLAGLAAKDRARTVSYLPQGQSHAWPLPVSEVVALGRYPHGKTHTDQNDVVETTINRMGLTDLREQSVLTLSGGEQMRVAMARALAVEADFLLADEPLASLDPRHQFAMMDSLREEALGGHGVAVVVHDLRLAALYADRIIMLNDGQVVADDTPEEVLSGEMVGDIFGVASQREVLERADGGTVCVSLPARSSAI